MILDNNITICYFYFEGLNKISSLIEPTIRLAFLMIKQITCLFCHKEKRFLSQREANRPHVLKGYCSLKCKNLAEKTKICPICQKVFLPSLKRIKFCSYNCYWKSKKGKIVNQMFGINNPKWNPNKQSRTYPSQYLKEKVKTRDNYKCYICGSKENLCIHHLKPFKIIRQHNIENLITLCHDCHWKAHRKNYQFSSAGMDTEGRWSVWMIE